MAKCRFALPFVAAVIVGVAPYLQTAGFDFVNLDDYEYRYIPQIEAGLSLRTFVWGFTFLDQGIWMPLTWCSYALDVSLFGGTPGGMHLVNAIIHGLSSGLIFLVFSSLMNAKGRRIWFPPLLVALFWAVHPLRVESVAWIASRKDVMSFFFELVALLLWTRYLKTGGGGEWFFRKPYWFAFLFFVLATMSKPSAMTFPAIAALLDIFVVRRWGDVEGEKWNWKPYIPLFAYAGVIAVLAQRAQAAGGAVGATGAPLWWRTLNAVASYGIYVFHTVWPARLAAQCVCRWPDMPKHLPLGVVCVVAAGAFIVLDVFRHWKGIREFKRMDDWTLAGLLIFTVSVGPFLGIASFGNHAFADRFTYVPSFGLCIAFLGLLGNLPCRAFRAACCLAPVVLAALAVCSWRQTGFWKNDERLFRNTVEVDDDRNVIARKNLATYYFEVDHNPGMVVGEYELARQIDEERAIDIADLYIMSLFEMGLKDKGVEEMYRFQRRLFARLEQDRLRNNQARQTVSVTFRIGCAAQAIAQGEYDIAIDHLKESRKSFPGYNLCDYLEGVMCLRRGNPGEALAAFRSFSMNYYDPYMKFRWITEKLPADDAEALKILPSFAWKTPDDAEKDASRESSDYIDLKDD